MMSALKTLTVGLGFFACVTTSFATESTGAPKRARKPAANSSTDVSIVARDAGLKSSVGDLIAAFGKKPVQCDYPEQFRSETPSTPNGLRKFVSVFGCIDAHGSEVLYLTVKGTITGALGSATVVLNSFEVATQQHVSGE